MPSFEIRRRKEHRRKQEREGRTGAGGQARGGEPEKEKGKREQLQHRGHCDAGAPGDSSLIYLVGFGPLHSFD